MGTVKKRGSSSGAEHLVPNQRVARSTRVSRSKDAYDWRAVVPVKQKNVVLTFRMPKDEFLRLVKRAQAKGVTISHVIRTALAPFVRP